MAMHELIRLREHPGAVCPFTLVYYQGQTETGRAKRHRLFFKTLRDAEAEQRAKKTELLNAGIVHEEITDEERRAVVFAREELAKLPAPAGGGAHSITAAINLYCEQARLNLKSATVSEYLPKFLERQRKQGKAGRTVSDLKQRGVGRDVAASGSFSAHCWATSCSTCWRAASYKAARSIPRTPGPGPRKPRAAERSSRVASKAAIHYRQSGR
jgi:hypothetical protein